MIKVEVTKKNISILGHAMYDDYGKDIVCAAVSSIVMALVEGIASIDKSAIDIEQKKDNLNIIINKHDDITNKLIKTMINLLKELEKKYPKNIKITNKEE
jgi:uncharacterized protein YsxB (DUF464 family)